MPLAIVMLAAGERRYLDEALAGIAWHRRRGLENPIELWVDPSFGDVQAEADVRRIDAVASASPSFVVGWYYKTVVLREKCREGAPFCLLDAYARVLRPDLFDAMAGVLARFSLCLSLDPRRTLGMDVKRGRGVSPEAAAEVADLPETFPLWNTGVVFASPGEASRRLTERMERICRNHLERGLMIREQIALARAAADLGLAPLTLPDNYNVRRPFIDPAIVLHTRRYGHLYGAPEVDTESTPAERVRHRLKATAVRLLRLRNFLGGA